MRRRSLTTLTSSAKRIEAGAQIRKIGREAIAERSGVLHYLEPCRSNHPHRSLEHFEEFLPSCGLLKRRFRSCRAPAGDIFGVLSGARVVQQLSLTEHAFCHAKKLKQKSREGLALQAVAPDGLGNPCLVSVLRTVVMALYCQEQSLFGQVDGKALNGAVAQEHQSRCRDRELARR